MAERLACSALRKHPEILSWTSTNGQRALGVVVGGRHPGMSPRRHNT